MMNSINSGISIGEFVTVSPFTHNLKDGQPRWLVRCINGVESVVFETDIQYNLLGKCTCDVCTIRKTSGTKVYDAWKDIKQRCYNENSAGYRYYGAVGVKMFAIWIDSFVEFYKYIGNPPSSSHSIDRINPFGNYEPGNVRWATQKEQANNKRANWLKKQTVKHEG